MSPVSPTPALSDEATLEATLDCVLDYLPIDMQGDCPAQTLYEVLLWAASRQDSIEHACEMLEGVPSSNDIRYHLHKFDDLTALEAQVNAALQSHLPDDIINHRHRLAIDLHLIPYYGVANEQDALYVYRSAAKAGTTRFFAYATLYVVRAHQRVTLAIHAIPRTETMVATITYLLAHLTPWHIKIKRLYLDRGFYSVPVIRWLKALCIPFIMPAIIRGKKGGTRALCTGRKSRRIPYTMNSRDYGSVTFDIAVVCRYHKGRRAKHGIQYLLFVVHRVKVALHQLPVHYRDRFGIETSYRIKNQCRIRTTMKSPVIRLLFVALAFILMNLWIWLLWTKLSRSRRGGRRVYQERFRLRTMLEFLRHAIEQRFPLIHHIFLPETG